MMCRPIYHDIFIKHVGTEDGKVYKCSKAYSAHYLDVYEVKVHYLYVVLYVLRLYTNYISGKIAYIIHMCICLI